MATPKNAIDDAERHEVMRVWVVLPASEAIWPRQRPTDRIRHRLVTFAKPFVASIRRRPPKIGAGQAAYYIPNRYIEKRDEIALTMLFVAKRQLFGMAYSGLQPGYFWSMPRDSGVYVGLALPTRFFTTEVTRPGDVDLLVIPYEGDKLIVHRTLAIEIKAVRASFHRQGKSPNEFGFTQAGGLQAIGFPYVAVAHLIVSDASPQVAWREIGVARIIGDDGAAEMLDPIQTDCLPIDLMERSFGRILKQSPDADLGLVAAYIQTPDQLRRGGLDFWHPDTRHANFNPKTRQETLQRIADFFESYPEHFLDNPRHSPSDG